MLPSILKMSDTLYSNDSGWNSYLIKIGDFARTIDRDFLSSVCLEHFDRFNYNFPEFNINNHRLERVSFTAEQIYNEVRYCDNKPLDFWYSQVDDYLKNTSSLAYPELKYCIENKKWSFCPVIIDHIFGCELGGRRLGHPYHLIEGTHRVSFINRLYERNIIDASSIHELIVIKP
ncbi:hypothetical protein C7Y70_13045 [Pseudoalteromonas sp. KS88]|uniref:hypothetical protein n=1 Tax=Pseudoalteromonas sp. KS88 TaxID=2109918 RepID=UPI0010818D6C|nr:hypothetical protein [Pseudoalteromonas sp. KS88]TGE81328.1 hypothetical protein C7Y70_13045 [Pseudoalteromonas sp. KS88]